MKIEDLRVAMREVSVESKEEFKDIDIEKLLHKIKSIKINNKLINKKIL